MESLKRTSTDTPIGTLANYSVTSAATPTDPTDSSGAIPAFQASVTDVLGDAKQLGGTEITLRDWTGFQYFSAESGNATRGRVTSVKKSPTSGMVTFDASTIFERLNTEQTALPILQSDTLDHPVREALSHWCLMAGVPEFGLEGNLKSYISNYNQLGYLADSAFKWRYFGPPSSYKSFVTTETSLGGFAPTLDVNLSQTLTFGMAVQSGVDLSEFRIQAFLPHLQQNVIYTLRKNLNVWSLVEKIGSGAATTLKSATLTPSYTDPRFLFVQIGANTASDKIDIAFRLLERDYTTGLSYYTDSVSLGVTSTLRNRPKPFQLDVGYDSTLAAGKVAQAPDCAFILEDPTLQEVYPPVQTSINVFSTYPAPAEEAAKLPVFVPGFTGNVWDQMREFCSMLNLDIYFQNNSIVIKPRETLRRMTDGSFIPAVQLFKAGLSESVQDRETARSVEVKYTERVPGSDNYEVMYKADSVFSLEKGETKVEVVKTGNTFVFLNQPVPVSGVPVPYTSSFGSYVVTGNDGYIVDPQWWKDNGGSITVKSTKNAGEIEITMQAPTIDTVRAPYRISEGVADRPALYIVGYGLAVQEPKTLKVYTGNSRAAQDVGVTFESQFITTKLMAMNTAVKLAESYGTVGTTIGFNTSSADYPGLQFSSDMPTPVGNCIYFAGSYYRLAKQTVTPTGMQFSDSPTHNTISVVNGEFAEGKTVNDWNTLHANKTIAETNLAPLPLYES